MTMHAVPNDVAERLRGLSLDELRLEQADLNEECDKLSRHDKLTNAQDERLNALIDQRDMVDNLIKRADLKAGIESGKYYVATPDGFLGRAQDEPAWRAEKDRGTTRQAGPYDNAARALDEANRSAGLEDVKAEHLEELLRGPEARQVAEYVEAASSPHYLTAFQKRMADPEAGSMLWNDKERAAYQAAHEYAKRTSLILSGASAMLPTSIDPAVLLTNAGSTGGLLESCRRETIATNQASFVTSAGATAEWVGDRGEGAQAADGTPTLAGKSVPVYTMDANAVVSWEVEQDALDFANQMAIVLRDCAKVAIDAALTTGSGSGRPTGLITALVAATGQSVSTGGAYTTAGTGVASVYALQAAVPARWQHQSSFVMPLAVINATRQLQLGTSSPLAFPELTTGEGTLSRRPLVEDSNLSADMSTTGSKFAVYGDLSQYVVVSRLGTTMAVIPQLGSNGRPTLANNHLMWLRVGADCLIASSGSIKYLAKS